MGWEGILNKGTRLNKGLEVESVGSWGSDKSFCGLESQSKWEKLQ